MSQGNVEFVRSIYTDWERGDFFSRSDWADPEIEYILADGPDPGRWTGRAAAAHMRDWLSAWNDWRVEATEYRELDSERILVLVRGVGRGKTSGLQAETKGASVFTVRDGKVMRVATYDDRDRALADLGLEE